ncbi:MAG: ABC transporter substrate-binding protein [Acidimicrobiales bacterium]
MTVVAPVAHTFYYLPSQLGLKLGVWQKLGLSVQNVVVQGAGQSAQLLAAGSADIELGTGPTDVNAIMRGLNAKILGATGLSFKPFVLVVPANSTIKSPSDLKGHTIGITGKGALTDYVVQQLVKREGWPVGSVNEAPLGGLPEQLAAMKAGSIDGFVWTAGAGFALAAKGEGKIAFSFSQFIPTQVFETLTASDAMITQRRAALSAYVNGWYQVARYMKDNPKQTIAFVASTYGVSTSVATQIYNYEIPGLSLDGTIPSANLSGMLHSAVTQGTASAPPPVSKVLDTSFIQAAG